MEGQTMLHRPRALHGEPPWPADRHPSGRGSPAMPSGLAAYGYDRIPRRPASGDHAGRRQGLRRSGLRDGAARDQRHTTYRPEHQPAFRHRCAVASAIPAMRSASASPTDRGRLRLDEDRRWAPKDEVSRPGQGWTFTFAAAAYNLIRPTEADDGAGLMARKQVPALALAFKRPLADRRDGPLGQRCHRPGRAGALSHSTARKARCDSSPCAPGSTFATAAVMAFPSPSSPGRASTRQISVLDGVGLPQLTMSAFTAISSSTMETIPQASPASPTMTSSTAC